MSFDCEVLIAGGGPTGVTLAVLLAKRGVRVIVAEKEAGIYPLPRAAHVDHECMRILQEAGVADEVMATSRRAARCDFLSAKGDVLLRMERKAAYTFRARIAEKWRTGRILLAGVAAHQTPPLFRGARTFLAVLANSAAARPLNA